MLIKRGDRAELSGSYNYNYDCLPYMIDMSSLNCNTAARAQVFRDVRFAVNLMSAQKKEVIDQKFDEVRSSPTPLPVVDGILIDQFIEKHTAVNGTVAFVSSIAEVPKAVGKFLDRHDLPKRFVTGKSDAVARLDWPEDWQMECRSARKTDLVSVTDAVCAVAESGTIVVASSAKVSSTHMFLPDNHVVVLNVGQVVRHLDDALQIGSQYILKESRGFHMITGPSKTADVEQTIQYGAHGPRRLHTIILDAN